MNCPICEQSIVERPVIFQRQYFPRLQTDRAICKMCYNSWPEEDILNMLVPSGDRKGTFAKAHAALYEKELRKSSYIRNSGFYLLLFIGYFVARYYFSSGNPFYLIYLILALLSFLVSVGCFIFSKRIERRLIEIKEREEKFASMV